MGLFVASEPTRVGNRGRFRSAFALTFRQFCDISSIHGIKYFHDTETNYFGKLIWLIIIIAMFFFANAMVYIFYQDFASNPIRMNIESEHTPLTNLIFPSVTICPPTMYNYREVKKIFSHLKLPANLSLDETIDNLNELYPAVGKGNAYNKTRLSFLQNMVELNNMTTIDFIKMVRWDCADLFFRCRFQSKIVNCTEVFSSSRTHTGYCCSFNINEYGSTSKYPKYPALNFGSEGGLSIILKDTETGTGGRHPIISGEKELYVHHNDAFPHKTLTSNSIQMNREIFAVIRPTEIVCSDSFKSLAIQDRQCLLPHEHNMSLFKTYTSDNCEFECRAMSSFEACGCFPYFFVNNYSKSKACDFNRLSCIKKLITYFENVTDTSKECYCPNSCESIEFDVKITQTQLQSTIVSFDPFYNGIQENHTVLHIFMNSQVYRRLRRDTLSDLITLAGNLGSSFSLFVGMSLLSLLEIAYFFTLVLWQNYSREG